MALSRRDAAILVAAARAFGIPPAILRRQILQESGGNERARSSAGALGIAQFMPATARGMGVDPLNPRSALFGAARMDAQNLRKYGDWRDVLSAYNSGRPWAQGRAIAQTRNYVRSILGSTPAGAAAIPSSGPKAPVLSAQGLGIGPDALKQQIARSLIAASQASAQGQTPDYAPLFELLRARTSAGQVAASPSAGESTTVLPGGVHARGVAHFDGKPVAAWIAPILKAARAAGWHGTVESGYRTFADQSRIYASGVRPAARPGTSNHEMTAFPGGAVDVTDAAHLSRILRRLGVRTLQWAGAKDPVHFSHPHGGSY